MDFAGFTSRSAGVVLLLLASMAHGQTGPAGQGNGGGNGAGKVKAQSYSGTIMSVGADGASFVVADKSGMPVTVRTSAATTFQLDKATATFAVAVRPGLTVKGNLSADGSAADVASKSPKVTTVDQIRLAMNVSDDE